MKLRDFLIERRNHWLKKAEDYEYGMGTLSPPSLDRAKAETLAKVILLLDKIEAGEDKEELYKQFRILGL